MRRMCVALGGTPIKCGKNEGLLTAPLILQSHLVIRSVFLTVMQWFLLAGQLMELNPIVMLLQTHLWEESCGHTLTQCT